MILARAASSMLAMFVISASVSRNVIAFRVQDGPTSLRMFAIPTDASDPWEGETLLATPGLSDPMFSPPIIDRSIVAIAVLDVSIVNGRSLAMTFEVSCPSFLKIY